MEIAYIGIMYPERSDYYKKNINSVFLQTSTSKFCFNQVKGLENVYKKRIKVISVPWVPSYPLYPEKEIYTQKWSHDGKGKDIEIGYRNKRYVKTIDQYHNLINYLKAWIMSKPKEQHIIFACSITFSILLALYRVKKLYPDVKICMTIVDLPGKESCEFSGGINGLLKRIVATIDRWLVRDIDGFVFLTKYMARKMVEKKPYVVVEGFVNPCSNKMQLNHSINNKIALMAGWLNFDFDIEPLLKTYAMDDMKEYTLWLAGSGDAVSLVKKYARKYHNIKYFGYVSPDEVARLQSYATILINPRRNNHYYIKYSFPGKTFESLCSGKPYLGFKLDCMSEDYDNYIIYFEGETESDMAKRIKEICDLSDQQRKDLSDKAKNWVLENKNPTVQCEKIKRMMDRI